MKRKNVIILCSLVALCAIGLVASHYIDWPVEADNVSGDIGKASRFSREMKSEKLTNMEELIQTDSNFKDGIVAAQTVMQTRAIQFGSLVEMSNEVAGNIDAFADVLKEMNANKEMVNNVTKSLSESAANLNAALGGEECPDLTQNTINASLAYTTLQKQNKLADQFIETTDKYLESAQGDDKLKFVRDQWVEYQKMTAALDGDQESAEAMAKKGNLLSGEKSLAAMVQFNIGDQVSTINSAFVQKSMNIDGALCNTMTEATLQKAVLEISQTVDVICNNATEGAVKNLDIARYNQVANEAIKNAISATNSSADVVNKAVLSHAPERVLGNTKMEALGMTQSKDIVNVAELSSAIKMVANAGKVMEVFGNVMNNVQSADNVQQISPANQLRAIGEAISQIAVGERALFGFNNMNDIQNQR